MQLGVGAYFARHGGLITRSEALDAGLSAEAIASEIRHGAWILVRRGVYADASMWNALDEHVGRPRTRARAAVLMMKRSWVMSHESAAYELGLDILRPEEEFVHVTRPGFMGAWTKHGIKHHLAHFEPAQVVEVEGRGVLDVARTAIDIAREHEYPHGLVACDSAMRRGVTRQQLWDVVNVMQNWPFSRRMQKCVELADPGAQSVLESLGRDLVHELDIGEVESQFPVQIGHHVYWGDLRVGNHIFECEGKIKLLAAERSWDDERTAEQVGWDEKKRHRLIAGEHLGVSKIIYEDCFGPRRVDARKRLRAEYAVTLERFGPVLHERLARNAAQIRGFRAQRGA